MDQMCAGAAYMCTSGVVVCPSPLAVAPRMSGRPVAGSNTATVSSAEYSSTQTPLTARVAPLPTQRL